MLAVLVAVAVTAVVVTGYQRYRYTARLGKVTFWLATTPEGAELLEQMRIETRREAA